MSPDDYLAAAERYCEARGSKLTALRRQVLALVLSQPGVVKAYQVLADLQRERGAAAPPTVYRALDFLVEQGLLHRVDALNGFIVCPHFECAHEGLILVCERCGLVEEADATNSLDMLHQAAAERGFAPRRQNLVLTGTCKECHA
ncbi:transcriptional repressor [Gulbenkiania mobilis]|uniref:Fur family zinc uptake transcriptional regulator n=1 Tax=Gulbenkiania mobilis TaxID=397457 RepID=A0ABY2CWC9_GULMO|nr:transcriptional repressor [Gulbenkiania mobilis]TCW31534.1 Fur family zinc uptake transcriptional regulator [Gulbenkiania mobilis]